MLRVEVLYPEYMNLYGDPGNIRFLRQSVGDVEVWHTSVNDKPRFLENKVDLLYLGPSTEDNQLEVVELLLPHKDTIRGLIENHALILATGNAMEIFGEYIETADGEKIEALGIFNVYAKRTKDFRYNELCLGVTKSGLEIVGFKNQMSHMYGGDENYFQDMALGTGRNPHTKTEGICYRNFIGTYILGPILPLNPYFAKDLLKMAGIDSPTIAFEEDAYEAYRRRLSEFKRLCK